MIDMKAEETTMVSITLNQYRHFVQTETALTIIMDAVYEGCSLSYNKSNLCLNDAALEALLRIIDKERYHQIYEFLKGKENGTDKD